MKKLIIVCLMFLGITISSQQAKLKTQVVEAACGQCQFDMQGKKGCDLAVRINGKSYFVEETVAFCRANNLKKLEIIHGIGDGVLQRMVHDYLVGQTNLEFDDHDFFYHQRGSVMVTLR